MVEENPLDDEYVTIIRVDVKMYEMTPDNGVCPLYIKRVTIGEYEHVSTARGSASYSYSVLNDMSSVPPWNNFAKYLTHFGQYRLETIDEYSYYTQVFNDTRGIDMLV